MMAQPWANVEHIGPTLIQHSISMTTVPATTAAQNQKAVSAYLKSKQLLPFGFADQINLLCVSIADEYS